MTRSDPTPEPDAAALHATDVEPTGSSPTDSSPTERVRREPRWSLPVAVTAGVVGLAVLGAGLRGALPATPRLDPGSNLSIVPTPTPPPSMVGPSEEGGLVTHVPDVELGEPPEWLREAGLALVVVVILVVVILVLRYLLARRPERRAAWTPGVAGARGDVLDDLEAGLERASEELLRQRPARDAVIAAWVELEQVGAAHGAARAASQTATEYTVALLRGTGVAAEPLEALRQVYLRARFSSRAVTDEDVAVAADALARIRAAWPERAESSEADPDAAAQSGAGPHANGAAGPTPDIGRWPS